MNAEQIAFAEAAMSAHRAMARIDGRPLDGCAYPGKGFCFIVWSFDPSGRDPHMADNVRRHEIAHCNGWPAHHPGAR